MLRNADHSSFASVYVICSYTDIREKNIYIMPLFITGTGAVIISLVSMTTGDAGTTLNEYLMLPAFAGLSAVLSSYVFKRHIGTGDALLLGVLGLVTGIRTDIASFAAGFIVVSIFAAVTLMMPQKLRIRSIPFAPFVMTGYVMVLVNEI